MKHPHALVFALAAAFAPASAPAQPPAPEAAPAPAEFRQALKSAPVPGGGEVRYLEALPADYADTPGKRWPLVIFLHGSGERGTDTRKVAKHGPPRLVEAGQAPSFILLSPQCDAGKWWDVASLDRWLDSVLKDYRVDERRIYLTGLSMGGFGTWAWAQHAPGRFAAIVPICGGGDPAQAEKIRELPVWAFHGDKDTAVSPDKTLEMVAALEKAGGKPRVTIYPGVGHDSWTRTYDNPELLAWMLGQERP